MSYNNFCIYKIHHKDYPDNFYIGSTTNFSQRKSAHKKNVNNKSSKKYHYPLYQYIRSLGGWGNFNCIIYEKYPCNTKHEGLKREQEIITELNATLNNMKASK